MSAGENMDSVLYSQATKVMGRKLKTSPLFADVSKLAGKAMKEFDMVREGDKIAVAVSGGKDSIALLHILRDRQRVAPVKFDFEAVHIDFRFSDFNPDKLISYLNNEGFSYSIESVDDLEGEKYEEIDCYRWSKARRKILFQLMQKRGFTKLAFGHHLDDIVETIVLNQFYRGEVGAMKPRQEIYNGDIVIIRPLAFVREIKMVQLANVLNIESIGGQSKCANDDTSHRMIIKDMLRKMEEHNPSIVKNIFNSLKNIKKDYLLKTLEECIN